LRTSRRRCAPGFLRRSVFPSEVPMKAAVISAVGQVEVATVGDPVPGERDVVVEVAACGICGTDLHILGGEFAPSLPVIPGHEFAGVVAATGRAVTRFSVGDRVAVDPSLY